MFTLEESALLSRMLRIVARAIALAMLGAGFYLVRHFLTAR